jgi:nucleotide-binding universal stress UspA family protein
MTALDWAARQAELTGSTLVIVTTWEWPSFGWDAIPLPEDYHPESGGRVVFDDALATVRVAHPTVAVRPLIAEGHPAPVLVEASRGADLLVVGCRGHGEFSGMLLGSVSMHCALHAHCPVVVVHAPSSGVPQAPAGDTGAAAKS